MRKTVLGRGLEALISQDLKESVSETERVMELEINSIEPNPFQPRTHFDENQLRELAESIRKNGVIQPVVVRRVGDRYQLIMGERRLRGSKLAGKTTIPAIISKIPVKTPQPQPCINLRPLKDLKTLKIPSTKK